MISVASGLALSGMRPIAHSYTPFLVERPFEQVKLDLAHQGVAAVLVSIGASYDASDNGRTHQAPEDVALVSSLPDWQVHVPGHPDEAELLLRDAAADTGNVYIRLAGRANAEPMPSAGSVHVIRRGSPAVVIAAGPMLDRTLEATADLDVTVFYATTVRPFDGARCAPDVGDGGGHCRAVPGGHSACASARRCAIARIDCSRSASSAWRTATTAHRSSTTGRTASTSQDWGPHRSIPGGVTGRPNRPRMFWRAVWDSNPRHED